MNNRELEQLLKSARPPERPTAYWRDFPGKVSARLQRSTSASSPSPAPQRRVLPRSLRWSIGVATACLALALAAHFEMRHASSTANNDFLAARKCYHEFEALFPNQLQTIVFDQHGPRLMLADHSDVPNSTPLYLKICGSKGCQDFVTFSGQSILVDGENYEVLADVRDRVMLVSRHHVWSTANASSAFKIQARPLEAVM